MSATRTEMRETAIAKGLAEIPSVDVLGVPVHVLDRKGLTGFLVDFLRSGSRGWVSYVNVHAVNLASRLPDFKAFLNGSVVNYCDGEGVRWGASILGRKLPERIALTDWFYDVCELAERGRLRVYFLGSTEEVLKKTIQRLETKFPRLMISGCHHGYFEGDGEGIVLAVNGARPDILFVAMGMPKQEQWIKNHFDRLNARVILNAGSCLDYAAGVKKRCPEWMASHGLEWFYRLLQEPRRLWRRYLIGNPVFVFRVLARRLNRY